MAKQRKAGVPITIRKQPQILSKAESLYINEGFIGASKRQTRYTLAEYQAEMERNGQSVNLPSWLKGE